MSKLIELVESTLNFAQDALLTVGFVTFSEEFASEANDTVKNFALGGLFIIQCTQFVVQKFKSSSLLGDDVLLPVGRSEQMPAEAAEVENSDIKQESRGGRLLRVGYPVAKGVALLDAWASGIVKPYDEGAASGMVYLAFASFTLLLAVKSAQLVKAGSFVKGVVVAIGGAANLAAAMSLGLGHKDFATKALLVGGAGFALLTAHSGLKLVQECRKMPVYLR